MIKLCGRVCVYVLARLQLYLSIAQCVQDCTGCGVADIRDVDGRIWMGGHFWVFFQLWQLVGGCVRQEFVAKGLAIGL